MTNVSSVLVVVGLALCGCSGSSGSDVTLADEATSPADGVADAPDAQAGQAASVGFKKFSDEDAVQRPSPAPVSR